MTSKRLNRSARLKGTMLRDVTVARDIYQRIVTLFDQDPNGTTFRLCKDLIVRIDKRFIQHDIGGSVPALRQLTLFDNNGDLHSEKYPSHIRFNMYGKVHEIEMDWQVPKTNISEFGWNDDLLYHRVDGPALMIVNLKHKQPSLVKALYYERGVLHNLSGPAELLGSQGRLYYCWYMWDCFFPIDELSKIVSDPYKISKKEQVFLKLRYYKDNRDD